MRRGRLSRGQSVVFGGEVRALLRQGVVGDASTEVRQFVARLHDTLADRTRNLSNDGKRLRSLQEGLSTTAGATQDIDNVADRLTNHQLFLGEERVNIHGIDAGKAGHGVHTDKRIDRQP